MDDDLKQPPLKPKDVPDDPVKSERFIDAARALGVTESEEAFDKAMRALLKLKPNRGSR